jgi:hypothetical protein
MQPSKIKIIQKRYGYVIGNKDSMNFAENRTSLVLALKM